MNEWLGSLLSIAALIGFCVIIGSVITLLVGRYLRWRDRRTNGSG